MAKYTRKAPQKLTSTAKERKTYLLWSVLIPVVILLFFGIWHYRAGIIYYFTSNNDVENVSNSKDVRKHDARNIFLMSEHSDKSFGIDVSQYQSKIKWDQVGLINDRFPIDFIFVRATMGGTAKDKRFKENWKGVKEINKLRGAYHYFRPNENSIKQARNFIQTVELSPGDLPPVLDIEERPRNQSMDSLRVGLKRWLDLVENHYNVRPIVYSGDSYFTDFLEKEFKDYTLWIANYNFWIEEPKDHWDFWQFSERGTVKGIKGPVDLNMYRADVEELEKLIIPYK